MVPAWMVLLEWTGFVIGAVMAMAGLIMFLLALKSSDKYSKGDSSCLIVVGGLLLALGFFARGYASEIQRVDNYAQRLSVYTGHIAANQFYGCENYKIPMSFVLNGHVADITNTDGKHSNVDLDKTAQEIKIGLPYCDSPGWYIPNPNVKQ